MNKNRLSPQSVADLVKYACTGLAATMQTDRELFEKMNAQLPDELKFCYRTFQRYKAAALQHGEQEVEQRGKFTSLYADLYEQLLLAGMRQKENLINMMLDAEGNKWHRYKWLLEKKFPEFNQGCIMETFRRENSYQDEDYPMYQPRKQQPITVTTEVEQKQPVLPAVEDEPKVEQAPDKTIQPVAQAIKELVHTNETIEMPSSFYLPKNTLPNRRKRVPSVKVIR